MRNFLILIVSLLAPYALYASGCNQNPQAAFPTTPEMRALARAPETAGRAPFIPAPAIDREILASAHDASTRARVQAVQDRSNVYAMAAPAPGLFGLPAGQSGAGAQSAAPMPSAREFWSRPVPAAPQQQQAQPRYATAPDVYAMAPSGQPFPEAIPVLPALGFEPLPEPITLGPAVPTAGFYSQQQFARPQLQPQFSPQQLPPQFQQPFPAQNVARPAPALLPPPLAPPGPALPYQLRPGEKLLPPEAVPGLFLGSDAAGAVSAQNSMAAAGAAHTSAQPDSSAAPPPLLSLAPPGLPPPASLRTPAPQHRASRRLEALLDNTDAAPALAPLPIIAGTGNTNAAGKTVAPIRPASAVSAVRPPAAPEPAKFASAQFPAAPVAATARSLPIAPPAGLIPQPPPAEEARPVVPAPASDLHDFFRTDFWAAKQSPASAAPATAPAPVPALRPAPATAISTELAKESPAAKSAQALPAIPPLPSISAASGLKPPEDFARGWDAPLPSVKADHGAADLEVPTRVTLKPVRRKQQLQAIDSEVDVAPMNF